MIFQILRQIVDWGDHSTLYFQDSFADIVQWRDSIHLVTARKNAEMPFTMVISEPVVVPIIRWLNRSS